jgi:porphobilinogen synthase
MAFPIQRLRRLRQHESFRRMVRETRLAPSDLIYPMFVMEGKINGGRSPRCRGNSDCRSIC